MRKPRSILCVARALLLLGVSATSAQAGEPVGVVDAAATVIEARMPAAFSREALDRAALDGVARWLDAQTGGQGNDVLTKEEADARQARLRGQRFGLGIEYTVAAGRGLLVTGVLPGAPAADVDLREGDVIVAVDDRSFTGLSGAAIVRAVREQLDSGRERGVELDVRRQSVPLQHVVLHAQSFDAPAAGLTRHDDHLVARLDVVGAGVARRIADALESDAPDLFVLDLRDVDDGELADAVSLVDLFVGPGQAVLMTVDPAGRSTSLRTAAASVWEGELVVLVNRGTAGVAEAVASALRTRAGAVLAGTRTAGIATQPSFHPLGDGLVLKLADTALRAADGSSWAGAGLAPDLVVEPLQIPVVGPVRDHVVDIQLDAALRYVGAR